MSIADKSSEPSLVPGSERAPFPSAGERCLIRTRQDGYALNGSQIESHIPSDWNLSADDRQTLGIVLHLREKWLDERAQLQEQGLKPTDGIYDGIFRLIVDMDGRIAGSKLEHMFVHGESLVLPVLDRSIEGMDG